MYFKWPIFTKFIFHIPSENPDVAYKFSSDLEKVGIEWDISILNGTYVDVISEPIEIERPQYGGLIRLVKVRADVATDFHEIIKEFWVPENSVHKIESASVAN